LPEQDRSYKMKTMTEDEKLDPGRWVDEHGDYLYQFAFSRLRDRSAAEDAVQETMISALKAAGSYAGRSSERNWLMGILKHKIYDYFRDRKKGAISESELPNDSTGALFNRIGHWKNPPEKWDLNPEAVVENREFWKVLSDCLHDVPEQLRLPFVMRQFDDKKTDQICNILGISATNLRVRLYRARTMLRECLETNWFGEKQ